MWVFKGCFHLAELSGWTDVAHSRDFIYSGPDRPDNECTKKITFKKTQQQRLFLNTNASYLRKMHILIQNHFIRRKQMLGKILGKSVQCTLSRGYRKGY